MIFPSFYFDYTTTAGWETAGWEVHPIPSIDICVHITGGSPQSPTTGVRRTLPGVRGTLVGFAQPSRGL